MSGRLGAKRISVMPLMVGMRDIVMSFFCFLCSFRVDVERKELDEIDVVGGVTVDDDDD